MILRALAIVLGIFGLVGLVVVVYSVIAPDGVLSLAMTKDQLNDFIGRDLPITSTFRPLLDIILFAAAYVSVCAAQWLQHSIATYLTNRRHFE